MKTLKTFKLILFTFLTIFFIGCNEDSNDSTNQLGNPKISVKLVDAPGDYDHVFVEVVDVMVKYDEGDWQSLNPENTGIYDLLDLTGGTFVMLVDDFEVPAGNLNQMRLVLGENNTIVIDGEDHPLTTPSAQQSGLKLQLDEVLEPGFTYDFILDFDVDRSIVVAGNSGNIILKPVINASTEVSSGKIEGNVNPYDFQVMASVEVADGEISTYVAEDGTFVLMGVPAGTYTVTFTPEPGFGYEVTMVENVEVENGQSTNLGIVNLIQTPGSITGTVTNEGVSAMASLEIEGEITEAATNESGVFLLENIPVGTYVITITPEEGSGLQPVIIENVEVTSDNTTDLGNITLNN